MTPGGVRDSGGSPHYGGDVALRTRPTAEDQIRFIASVEHVLAGGSFVATYKYALLIALVDLAIEHGDDSNDELPLRVETIADKFAELYWRQSVPYCAGDEVGHGFLLHQNAGRQAKAIRLLATLHGQAPTLAAARRSAHWKPLVAEMRVLLQNMPLWKLQRVGREYVEFLYRKGPRPGWITLLPGVAAHLRERAPLIRRLAQTEWLRFVLGLKQNQGALGAATGLSEFLFGSSRAALSYRLARPLRELHEGRCFYCRRGLTKASAVDHFIPWSMYPRDLVHNLVIAHASCNADKSDLLGGEEHLERWVGFVKERDRDLARVGAEAGLLVDRATTVAVAAWSYEQAERVDAQVWLGRRRYGHLTGGWRVLVAA